MLTQPMLLQIQQSSSPSLLWIALTLLSIFASTGCAAVITSRATRRNLDSDSLKKIADATVVLIDPMEKRIKTLETRVTELSHVAEQATAKYVRAVTLLRAHHIDWNDDDTIPGRTGR